MQVLAVVTTIDRQDAAQALARALLERGLVACAQIDAIESLYHWNGALQQEPEWRVTFKTLATHYEAVRAAILQQHHYTLPAIHAVVLEPIHTPYAQWIAQQCAALPKTAPAPGG